MVYSIMDTMADTMPDKLADSMVYSIIMDTMADTMPVKLANTSNNTFVLLNFLSSKSSSLISHC